MGLCRAQVSACSCASLATSADLLSSVNAFIVANYLQKQDAVKANEFRYRNLFPDV